jgi:hypothetical protein
MPGPRRRDDEIAGMHRGALAVHGGIRAASFDDEAQRRLRMAMARRDFTRQEQLQAAIEAAGNRGLPAHPGILENQHAAHGFARRDQRFPTR